LSLVSCLFRPFDRGVVHGAAPALDDRPNL